jgi:spore photoproduct lyase
MKEFVPELVLIEKGALDYKLAKQIKDRYEEKNIPVRIIESHNRVKWEKEMTPLELFEKAKETLVVGVKKTLRFKSCQPSADYRVVSSTSCPAKCEYCYLATNLGSAVYVRVYVNIKEIIRAIKKHIRKSDKEITTFEASSSSDPVAVEHITGNLSRLIEFFARRDDAKLRVATKFNDVEPFLDLNHNRNTKFRFSISSGYLIKKFENLTPSLTLRLEAANKLYQAGYPLGFIIAPIMVHEDWRRRYREMFKKIKEVFRGKSDLDISFELIMFRFSTRSKNIIESRYPETELSLDKEKSKHKGFGKYVYPDQVSEEIREYMTTQIEKLFPQADIEYFT